MCTKRRIGSKNLFISETKAFCDYRNEKKSKIAWKLTKEVVDEKLSKHYV
jgi:hypothetical protein